MRLSPEIETPKNVMRPQVGQVINNKYRLIRLVGDGGMGSVYEARHEVLGTTVALKFLHPELSRRSGLVQRFLQEARVSAHIVSPHVVRVTDVDQTSSGLAYLVMEFVEGRTLQTLYEELYRAHRRLSYTDGLEYALQTLDGVEAAHRAGVVHRDLKPDNVMITHGPKGEARILLLDFGIAKLKVTGELDRGLTRPGVMMGTPEYMAPEQAYSADAVDARADIFSLGVMIFEMLAGRRPVGGDEPHEIAAAYLAGKIARLSDLVPGIDPDVVEAIHRAMAPLPADRFSTVAELRHALEPAARAAHAPSMAGTPAPALTPSPAQVAPAPAAAASDERRAVPKTLPPEEDPPPAAEPPSEAPAGPVHLGTPLGGFSVHEADAAPASPEAAASPDKPIADDAHREPMGPLVAVPATNFDSPVFPEAPAAPPERPGGTAVGSAAFADARPATVGATGSASAAAPLPSAYTPNRDAPKSEGKGISLLFMLGLAAGISALVVGGVYGASRLMKSRDAGSDIPTVEPPVPPPVVAAPTPSEPPKSTPVETPTVTPPHDTRPPAPKPTGTSQPKPTATPTTSNTAPAPTTTATTTPTTFPTTFPPFILPSVLPSLPFPTTPRPTATTTTDPAPKPTSSGRPPFIIIRPRK